VEARNQPFGEECVDINTVLAALRGGDAREDPYPLYAALHEGGTSAVPDAPGEIYSLVVYGYHEVEQALRNPALSVTDAHLLDAGGPGWREHATWLTLMGSMMFANAPEHTRMRRLIAQVFTPRRVAALEPAIVALIDGLMDRLDTLGAGGVPVDFLAEFAFPLPSDVIGEMLGVPEQDRAWFRPQVEAIGAVLDLGGTSAQTLATADAAATALREYFVELAAQRRRSPRDDLVSSLVQAGGLTEDELLGNLIVLFNAGFVTTTHLLGNGLWLLLTHPPAVDALRADPGRAASYVEEMLRYEAPVQVITRWAAADTEVAGVPIPRGGRILLLLGAANRDPRRFRDPDAFDPARPDAAPISFGAGIHYCIGAALSRLEGRIAFPRLLERFPTMALAEQPVHSGQLTLRGFGKLALILSS
jgi:cytochrome P450